MSQSTDSIVRVGIAGLGRAGWNIHAATLEPLADRYKVVAACDPDAGRQKEAGARFGCRTHAEFGRMLADEDIQLVVVAVPSQLHAEYSVAAMKAGKHVLVEKPMAAKLSDADRMVEVARETGRVLTVNQNSRNKASFLKVHEIVESGVLGRILQIRMAFHRFSRRWDWQTLTEFGGGILNNQGAHVVDRALLLLGDAEPQVFCRMERTPLYSGDAESHVKIILQGNSGPVIDIELTTACAYPQDSWHIMGTQGGLAGTEQILRWKYFEPDSLPPRPVDRRPTPDRTYNSEDLAWREETFDCSIDNDPGYRKVYVDLYASLREDAPLAITPQSVRRQIAVIDKCHQLGGI